MTTWRQRYKVHPAADVFPMMSDEELKTLGEDIKANGLKHAIVFDMHGTLIDGRNRLEAIERARIVSRINLDGPCGPKKTAFFPTATAAEDTVAAIISLNIHRRHLTKAQQADLIVAAHKASRQVDEVPKQRHVKGKPGSEKDEFKTAVVADANKHGISKSTVERAIANYEKATDHPNAPPRLRAKARRQRKRETLQHYHKLLATLPRTVEGARRFYLEIVARHVADIDAEMTAVVDGLQRIADQPEAERLKRRAAR
jgi:hypothetical protein